MTERTPDFDAVVEVAPGGLPVFDTKYSEQFWYVDDAQEVARHDPMTRNIVLPLPFRSREEITDEVTNELRQRGAPEHPLVLVRQDGRWGVFVGRWQ